MRRAAAQPDRPASPSRNPPWPADAVEIARIAGAWGVKGWVKVQPYAADPQALLRARHWFALCAVPPGDEPARRALAIVEARTHGEQVVAAIDGCEDRDAADALRGARVFVARSAFPPASADEYYWVDLIGASVVNRLGQPLGTVTDLLDTGPHSVLCVAPSDPGADERLIPFVAAYVDRVDVAARRIVVDWGLDY